MGFLVFERHGESHVNIGGLGVSTFLLNSRDAEHFALILVALGGGRGDFPFFLEKHCAFHVNVGGLGVSIF